MARLKKSAAVLTLAGSLLAVNAVAEDNGKQVVQDDGKQIAQSMAQGKDLSFGQGVVCNTVEQVERFTALIGDSRDIETSIKKVNTEAENPRACGLVMAAYVRGDEVGELRNGAKTVKVVEITIFAVPVNDKWHFVTPIKQYTAFRLKGVNV